MKQGLNGVASGGFEVFKFLAVQKLLVALQLICELSQENSIELVGQPVCTCIGTGYVWLVGGKSKNVSAEEHKFQETAVAHEFMVMFGQKSSQHFVG